MDSSMGAEFCFSSDADFPNKVKLRKRLPLWILEVTLGVDHDRHRHTIKPTCTVKDKFLKGAINIDVTKNRLEYKKVCGMPFLGQLVLDAGVNYRNPLKHPRIGVSVSTCGTGTTGAIANGDSITFDRRFSVGKRVSLEVRQQTQITQLDWPGQILILTTTTNTSSSSTLSTRQH